MTQTSQAIVDLIDKIEDCIRDAASGNSVDAGILEREATRICAGIPASAVEARALIPSLRQAIAALERLSETLQDRIDHGT